MQADNSDTKEIKDSLIGFINEQRKFNKNQIQFNEELIVKIDKIQYFLEESIASNAKMFFEEQLEMKTTIRELEEKVDTLKNNLLDLSMRVNILFKTTL